MRLSNILNEVESKLEEKVSYWGKHCPSLKFDEHGRVRLGELKPNKYRAFRNCCDLGLLANYITTWCSANDMAVNLGYSMGQVVYDSDLRYYTIEQNVLEYAKVDADGNVGKPQKMKITKWLNRLIKDITQLVDNTLEVGLIKSDIEYCLEGINEYLQASVGRELWLSINPLDKLTCSNSSYSKLTSFKSCWETDIYEDDDDIIINSANIYSNQYGILAVGMLLTSFTMYVPNGRVLSPFIGFSSRIQGYLRDNSTFFAELEYPSKQLVSDEIVNILERNEITIDNDPTIFTLQDYNGNRKLTNYDDEIYLDYVGIDYDNEEEMVGLSDVRCDADESRGTVYCDDMSNYYHCDSCGDRHHIDDLYCHDDSLYCNYCYNDRFRECEDCGQIIDTKHDDYIYNADGDVICSNCMYDYEPCYNCMDFYRRSDMTEIDKNDEIIYFCDDCTDCIDEL